jgi:hypothetical protein
MQFIAKHSADSLSFIVPSGGSCSVFVRPRTVQRMDAIRDFLPKGTPNIDRPDEALVGYPYIPMPVELIEMERNRSASPNFIALLKLRIFANRFTGLWITTTRDIRSTWASSRAQCRSSSRERSANASSMSSIRVRAATPRLCTTADFGCRHI